MKLDKQFLRNLLLNNIHTYFILKTTSMPNEVVFSLLFIGTEDLFILQKTPPLVNHHFFENYIKSNKPVFKFKKNR